MKKTHSDQLLLNGRSLCERHLQATSRVVFVHQNNYPVQTDEYNYHNSLRACLTQETDHFGVYFQGVLWSNICMGTRDCVHDRNTRYKNNLNIPACKSASGQRTFLFSVFTSHVIKTKIVTIQWIKSRIWDTIDEWYINNLAKNQVSLQKCVTQIYRALYGDAMFVSFWGTQTWRP